GTSRHRRIALFAAVWILMLAATVGAEQHDTASWVATWSASPQPAAVPMPIAAQTLRQIVHTTVGGRQVRIRLSNAYGVTPLTVGAAHIGVSVGGPSIDPSTDRTLRFNGAPEMTIPAGAVVMSDAVRLETPALSNLAVSLYLPDSVALAT